MTYNQAPQLRDVVDELTGEHAQRAAYTVQTASTAYTQRHEVRCPSLVEQLGSAGAPTKGAEGGGHRAGYGSKPAARLEALDTAVQIDTEAARWLRILDLPDTGDTAALLRRLYEAVTAFDPALTDLTAVRVRDDVVKDLWRWWRQARIVTGWDTPAWKPANTCPLCAKRGGLRVRLADHAAMCVECRQTWDPQTIGLLADHIRAENDDQAVRVA